jgi:hypothetical protein
MANKLELTMLIIASTVTCWFLGKSESVVFIKDKDKAEIN